MIIECKKCGKPISDQAYRCPHCNAVQNRDGSHKKRIFWIILICSVIVAIVIFFIVANNTENKASLNDKAVEEAESVIEDVPEEEPEEERNISGEGLIRRGQALLDLKENKKVRKLSFENDKMFVTPIYVVIKTIGDRRSRAMFFNFEFDGSWNATEYFDMGYYDGTFAKSTDYPNGQIESLNVSLYGRDSDEIDFQWDEKKLSQINYLGKQIDKYILVSYDGDGIKTVSISTRDTDRFEEYTVDYDLISEVVDENGNWIKRTWKASNSDDPIIETRNITYW